MAGGPLRDIAVLDFTEAVSGPVATTLLADLGADVVKIEPPDGSSQRRLADGALRPNVLRNKRSLAIDLKRSDSDEVMRPLLESADVLVHNYSPGTMERLGYDYESVRSVNEDVIYASLTGFGESGPYRDRKGFDSVAAAMSGLLWNTGEPDRKPSKIGGNTIDVGTGILTAFSIMAGLWNRERGGGGQKIETSLFETAAMTVMEHYTRYDRTGETPSRMGHTLDTTQPIGMFHTADDPIWLTCPYQHHWEALCETIDCHEWIGDPDFETMDDRIANWESLHGNLEDAFAGYTRADLVSALVDAGVPCGEVQTIAEAAEDPHLEERETVVSMIDTDGEEVLGVATPIHFERTPRRIETPPPALGEDFEEVLAEAGFSEAEIASFVDREIVSTDRR